jgi:hypothetical protein
MFTGASATTTWKNAFVQLCQYHSCIMSGNGRLYVGKNLSLSLLPVPPYTRRITRRILWKLAFKFNIFINPGRENQEQLITDYSIGTDVSTEALQPESCENQRISENRSQGF